MNKSGVYLIECPYDGINMLKIGCSSNISKRLNTHKSSNPLVETIGYIETNDYKWLEKDIHKKCKKYQYKGEWFYKKEAIIEFFKTHNGFIKL